MKRDFSFFYALLIAMTLHGLLGLGLRLNSLGASNPVPPAPSPVVVRFIEVPPESKTVPVAPETNNISDANRKAGPVQGSGSKRSAPFRQNAAPRDISQNQPAELPAFRETKADMIPGDSHTGTGEEFSNSLRDLDRYIGQGSGIGKGDTAAMDPGSGVFFDTQGHDLGPWGNQVIAIVKSNWIIPVAVDLGTKGIVAVSLQVDRSGNITNLRLISSSRVPPFDHAALSALRSSNPFPPLPSEFPKSLLPAVFRFYYNTPVQD